MNKKLFTLAAALMMGSAFTVNAQTNQAKVGALLDGKTPYYLKTATSGKFLVGEKLEVTDTSDPTKKASITTLSTSVTETPNDNNDLWYVTTTKIDGVWKVQLKNMGTGGILTFAADGSILTSSATYAQVKAAERSLMEWDNMTDADGDGTPDYVNNGGVLKISNTEMLNYSAGWSFTTSGENIAMFTEDASSAIKATVLNGMLGDGFSFSFPSADPKPAKNIFDQKLFAFAITNGHSVGSDNAWMNSYAPGLYFATEAKPADIVPGADEQNWFLTTNFVAVSPVDHLGIPSEEQKDLVGFDFTTVMGKDLAKTTATLDKTSVSSYNAAFTVVNPTPAADASKYAISLASIYVQKEAGKVPTVNSGVNVIVTKVLGANYVTVSKKDATKCVASATNMVAVKDFLSEKEASIFNIVFTSGATATNANEYGKYLGLGVNGAGILAQGPAFIDTNNAESQWVITAANATTGEFTFTNRENNSVSFKTTLRKTDNENVYKLSSASTFDYAFIDNNGNYQITSPSPTFAGKTVQLQAVTLDKTAGFANFSDEELNKLVKLQFEVGSTTLSKDLYVTVDNAYKLSLSQNIADAAQWEIIKRTSLTDSIYSTQSYAYWSAKDKAVKTDGKVEDRAIVTYSIKFYKNGTSYYYDGDDVMTPYAKEILAPRFVIKENVDGTIALIPAGAARKYGDIISKTTMGVDKTLGKLKFNESIYAQLNLKSMLYFGTEAATPSLEVVSRHASFEAVNGGFLGVGAKGDAIIAASKDEAEELTFWLDTTDVEKYTPSFYISQGIKTETKADEVVARNFLFNAADSAFYYDAGTASTISDPTYKLISGETKAIFKAATLVNKDSVNTVIKGKEVGLNNKNGLKNFKFNIVLADADVADEYVIKSVANNNYVANINGKVALVPTSDRAMVVKLGAGDATANEAIEAESGIEVIGGQGVVTVQGAAGKVITVANILGQTIANQVAASDNVTIAAPAGVVVVSVDGEATKVVVK